MPVAAIAAPAIAIGFAIATPTVFTIAAAVGATVAAVGVFTKVKELQIAGTVLGAIGGIGALASSAGLFGSTAGGLFGGAAETAGQVASDVTSLAGGTEGISAAAAPTGGYTLETLANSGLEGALAGFEPASGAMPTAEADIINLVNGAGAENFNALAPAEQIAGAQTVAPAAEVLPETTAAAAPQEAVLPEVAQEVPAGLVDSAGGTQTTQVGIDGVPRDQFGNVIAQGDVSAGGQGDWTNPAANPVTAKPVDASGVAGNAPTSAAATPNSTPTAPVTGTNQLPPGSAVTGTTGAEANLSGFWPGQGPLGPAELAARNPDGSLVVSPWSKILGFVEKNQTLSLGAIMGASSFISGAFAPGMTEEQRRAYAAQAEQNLAAANLARAQEAILQRRLRNMNDPIPVARPISPPPGLINSVTGTPA